MAAIREVEVGVGCILYLKPLTSTEHLRCKKHQDCLLEQEAYGHPVVAIGTPSRNNSRDKLVHFLLMTSSAKHLETRTPVGHKQDEILIRSRYWLEGSKWMAKPSYVKMEHVFALPLSSLSPYEQDLKKRKGSKAYNFRLDKASYITLMLRMCLKPQEYAATRDLKLVTTPASTSAETVTVYKAQLLDMQPARSGSLIQMSTGDAAHHSSRYASGSQSSRSSEFINVGKSPASISQGILVFENYSNIAVEFLGAGKISDEYTMRITRPVESGFLKPNWLQRAPSGLTKLVPKPGTPRLADKIGTQLLEPKVECP
ncbi:uncharacterized protein RAG0_15188 [Rhynchosporium agropyri]|uniref:Uncharacterized protein n=1 Tax=Rhynchosporium agropyri TaxID=914238 RepID=A0A1E1LK11_9HELO|nr:uncharacterized protein RAG0_15188 [Rhynchosporium agropyri]